MKNQEQPAFPELTELENSFTATRSLTARTKGGLTKLEYAAIMAMSGLISARSETLPENHDAIKVSAISIQIADELLKQLENK